MAEKPYPSPANTSEQLQNLCWRLAVEMRAIYNTVKTKMTKAEADKAYLGKTAKAESAKTADTATAVAWTGVTGRPTKVSQFTNDSGFVTTAATNGLIPKSGNAGTLTTSETIAAASKVNDTSARSMNLASGGSLTVANGSANMAWITVVALNGSATITLGSAWAWSGSSPTLAKGLVTLAWYGTFGVANFQKFGE
nr:MAG TPA: hypothetical protein [Caudoviricetes sp.]